MNVLILEDESKTARELAAMLQEFDDSINILAIIDSVEKARQWFLTNESPDLLFSDIHLADGLCFDLFTKIDLQTPVIFCTAFDEYLLSAFDTNAVSYLLKPVNSDQVEKALGKFRRLHGSFNNTVPVAIAQWSREMRSTYKSTILVNQREKIIPVKTEDIACCYLDNSILYLITFSNQRYFLTTNLDELERTLNPEHFYRANRQCILHRHAVANAERFFARKLIARLTVPTPEPVIVSKAKASDFLKWLEGVY